jgi:hypothetical protein
VSAWARVGAQSIGIADRRNAIAVVDLCAVNTVALEALLAAAGKLAWSGVLAVGVSVTRWDLSLAVIDG